MSHPSASPPEATPLAEVKGRIFDVQGFSIHDGPGIRTTVFLKGCPLRCLWCHNPESVEMRRDVRFLAQRCLLCGRCVVLCEHGGHELRDGVHVYHRERCVRCGACASECPSGAIEVAGREITAGEVIEQVERDRPFYERSGGGMTLSGGEPLMQPQFARALLVLAGERGLHRAIDTSGYASWEVAQPLFGMAELVLYDLKAIDDALHRRLTGVSNEPILRNLTRLLAMENGPAVWLRLPIIPGYTDTSEALPAMVAFCAELWGNPRLEKIELMPYHRLAESKYDQFGREYPLRGLQPPDEERLVEIVAQFAARGVPVERE